MQRSRRFTACNIPLDLFGYKRAMTSERERSRKVAVLIDAENASPRILGSLFEEFAAIGEASVRRSYGDFSGTRLKLWTDALATYAIVPHQTFATVTGKNAADIALVIDAMDLLHTGHIDAFCLVSSDSDFTRLASRIREQGVDVYGFGERKTPSSFRQACKRFTYTEAFGAAECEAPAPKSPIVATAPKPCSASRSKPPAKEAQAPKAPPATKSPNSAVAPVNAALTQLPASDGWYCLGALGIKLAAQTPRFNPKIYGCAKLSTLVEKANAFEIQRRKLRVYLRPKQGKIGGKDTGAAQASSTDVALLPVPA